MIYLIRDFNVFFGQALSCLETTSKHLGQSLDGRQELLLKVEELQQALVK